jgi:hypothetical protein
MELFRRCHYYIVLLVEDDYFIVLLARESGYQQLTSNFSKEFVREDKNVICYSNPWRTK